MILLRTLTVLSLATATLGVTLFNGWLIVAGLASAAVFGWLATVCRIRRRRAARQAWVVPRINGRRGNALAALALVGVIGVTIMLARALGW